MLSELFFKTSFSFFVETVSMLMDSHLVLVESGFELEGHLIMQEAPEVSW